MSKEILQADFIPVDLDNLLDYTGNSLLTFDKESFEDGLKLGSYFAGFATALFNAGIEEDNVAELLKTWITEHGNN